MNDKLSVDAKKIDLVCTAVTVFVLGFLLYYAFGASLALHQGKHVEYKAISEEQYAIEAMIKELQRGEKMLGNIHETTASLESRVPHTMDFQSFYDAVSESAQENELLLSEMQPGELIEQELFAVLPVSIEATGTFEHFCDFLFSVTHMARLAKLEQINIRPSGSAPLCNIRMTFNIFAKLEEASNAG